MRIMIIDSLNTLTHVISIPCYALKLFFIAYFLQWVLVSLLSCLNPVSRFYYVGASRASAHRRFHGPSGESFIDFRYVSPKTLLGRWGIGDLDIDEMLIHKCKQAPVTLPYFRYDISNKNSVDSSMNSDKKTKYGNTGLWMVRLRASTPMDKLPDRLRPFKDLLPSASSIYTVEDAFHILVNKISGNIKFGNNFVETISACVKLNIDPRRSDHVIRNTVSYPHNIHRKSRILAVISSDQELLNRCKIEGDADYVGGADLINKISRSYTYMQSVSFKSSNTSRYIKPNALAPADLVDPAQTKPPDEIIKLDVLICSPDMMSQVGKLGRLLGPLGLMPNPRIGTVAQDLLTAVHTYKHMFTTSYRADRFGQVRLKLGLCNMEIGNLLENFWVAIRSVLDTEIGVTGVSGSGAKKSSVKSTSIVDLSRGGAGLVTNMKRDKDSHYIDSVYLSTTVGPGLKIDLRDMLHRVKKIKNK